MAFTQTIALGRPCIGTWVTISDPIITELLSHSGFDFLFYDMEHAPLSLETFQNHLMGLNGTDIPAIVRLPMNESSYAKSVLDLGAAGTLIPNIRTAEDARRAVENSKYPPEGTRGIGPRRPSGYGRKFNEYIERFNREVITIVQIENMEAVRNAEAILQVPGLSGIFFGPNDLSADMGLYPDTTHPKVIAAMEHVTALAKRHKIPVGQWSLDANSAQQWAKKGIDFAVISLDYMLLARTADQVVAETRSALEAVRTNHKAGKAKIALTKGGNRNGSTRANRK